MGNCPESVALMSAHRDLSVGMYRMTGLKVYEVLDARTSSSPVSLFADKLWNYYIKARIINLVSTISHPGKAEELYDDSRAVVVDMGQDVRLANKTLVKGRVSYPLEPSWLVIRDEEQPFELVGMLPSYQLRARKTISPLVNNNY